MTSKDHLKKCIPSSGPQSASAKSIDKSESTASISSFESETSVSPPESNNVDIIRVTTNGSKATGATRPVRQVICKSPSPSIAVLTALQHTSTSNPEKRGQSPNLTQKPRPNGNKNSSGSHSPQIIRPSPLKRPATSKDISTKTVAVVTQPTDKKDTPKPVKPQRKLSKEERDQRAKKRLEDVTQRRQAQCQFPVHKQQTHPHYRMTPSNRSNIQIMGQPQHDHPTSPYYQHRPKMGGSAGSHDGMGSLPDMDSSSVPPTPLFERLVTEEVQELKSYARIIEAQNRRIQELQRIHDDLESRLEQQTKARMNLEAKLDDEKQKWIENQGTLEKECNVWKSHAQSERMKNEKLLEQVNRKDKEIHRMIQRKYDSASKAPHQPPHEHRHARTYSNSHLRTVEQRHQPLTPSLKQHSIHTNQHIHSGPHDILRDDFGTGCAVRERNVTNSLLDFFGMF